MAMSGKVKTIRIPHIGETQRVGWSPSIPIPLWDRGHRSHGRTPQTKNAITLRSCHPPLLSWRAEIGYPELVGGIGNHPTGQVREDQIVVLPVGGPYERSQGPSLESLFRLMQGHRCHLPACRRRADARVMRR